MMEFLDQIRKWITVKENRNLLQGLAAAAAIIGSIWTFIAWIYVVAVPVIAVMLTIIIALVLYRWWPRASRDDVNGNGSFATSPSAQKSVTDRAEQTSLPVRRTASALVIIAILFLGVVVIMRWPPGTRAPRTTFGDDFLKDGTLDSTKWIINGPVAVAAVRNFDNPLARIVSPTISLSTMQGLRISGIKGSYQQFGIQSARSFAPPFTATAKASAPFTGAGSLQFLISDYDGGSGVSLNGGVGANEVFTGFWLGSPSGPGSQWRQVGKLSQAPPQSGVVYALTISVDASGTGAVSIQSAGGAAQSTVQVGKGPFYAIMSQGSGYYFSGESVALWQSIFIAAQ
jgi:hypothetical protein